MPAPVGILAGMPETPGDIAERGMVRTQQMDLAEQANARAQGTAGMEQEKFQLEKQLVPYKMREAQQKIQADDLRFTEALRSATNKDEARRLAIDLYRRIGFGGTPPGTSGQISDSTLKEGTPATAEATPTGTRTGGSPVPITAQEFTAAMMQISLLNGDTEHTYQAMNDFKHIALETEQGKAADTLWTDVSAGGPTSLFVRAQTSGKPEDAMELIGRVFKDPKAAKVLGPGFMKIGLESLGRLAPAAYVDAVKMFYAKLSVNPSANASQLWTQILDETPDAAVYGKDHEPPEVKSGMAVQQKGAEAKAVAEAQQPGKEAVAKIEEERAIKVAEIVAGGRVQAAQIQAGATLGAAGIRVNRPTSARDATAALRADIALRASLASQLKDPALMATALPEVAAARKKIEAQIADVDLLIEQSRQDVKDLMKPGQKGAEAGEAGAKALSGIDVGRMKQARTELDKGVKLKGTLDQAKTFLAKRVKEGSISEDEEKRLLAEYTPKFSPSKKP